MRKIRDVLRLSAEGLSERRIGASLGIGHSGVGDTIRRARAAGLVWPLPDDLGDDDLERQLYRKPPANAEVAAGITPTTRPLPDWSYVHREYSRPNVTLSLLWEEYRAAHPDGLGRSQFCAHYRRWRRCLSPTMRQHHVAGDKMFVDYAGTTVDVIAPATGEIRAAQVFVATLGASSYTFVEATWTQSLPDWTGSHARALSFFGGVPRQIVSDNLKSGITKACFYEPNVNRTYSDLATHYSTAIVPARPYKPRDKAKVEVGVQVAGHRILAALRDRRFHSLAELNAAISELLAKLNNRVTRHLGASRRALFEELDRPALGALPQDPYVFSAWKQCTVGRDYHVEVDGHHYSVPHNLLREKVWARFTERTVEVLHRGKRVASHVRQPPDRKHTTIRDHMPSSHRRYIEWTPERLQSDADKIGTNTSALVEIILRERTHPEQGFRSCLGILRLAKTYGPERLDAACERALLIGARSYSSVQSILKTRLDRHRPQPTEGPAIIHSNIRGSTYFH